MFTVCVGLVFRSKYVQFPIICSLQYSINISTVEVDPHPDLDGETQELLLPPKFAGSKYRLYSAYFFLCLTFFG